MRPFAYLSVDSSEAAVRSAAAHAGGPPTEAAAQFLAGGTTLLDLMKLDVMRPRTLVDINGLRRERGAIDAAADGLRFGALVSPPPIPATSRRR